MNEQLRFYNLNKGTKMFENHLNQGEIECIQQKVSCLEGILTNHTVIKKNKKHNYTLTLS